MISMERKKALITGASRGIGRAIAREFAAAGYDLYLTCNHNLDILIEEGKNLEQEYGISCFCYAFPVYDEEKMAAMFQDIPYLDVLVNNAGISYIGLLTDMTYEEWKNSFVDDGVSDEKFTTKRKSTDGSVEIPDIKFAIDCSKSV